MKKDTVKCSNCEQEFNEGYSFCPYCGQKAKDELTLGVLFYNTISNYFSFDARFFKSFVPLLIKPGYLAAKFIEGKRLLYLHPAQMYLFIAVVFFFLFSYKANEQAEVMDKGLSEAFKENTVKDSLTTQEIEAKQISDSISREEARLALKKNAFLTGMTDKEIDSMVNDKEFNLKKNNISLAGHDIDSLIDVNAPETEILKAMGLKESDGAFKRRLYKQSLKFLKSKQGGSVLLAFYDTAPIAMFFILPIFALLLKLFYRKRGRYAHHLVFSFYYFAFLFTVFSIVLCINYITDISDSIDFLIVLSVFFYLIIALKRFYQQGWFKSFLKGSLTTMLFFPVLLIVSGFVLFFSFMFY
ncbi:DUF3667 domain-containing protein [Psychroserpens mesophilus]|uniref:DUF3667 domain-containing protein n=1 Tax=Psychroserpens mesophilus TaxID=325473 RepID=UPI003D657E3A